MAKSMPQSTGDSGSAEFGVTLPGGGRTAGVTGQVTLGHTVLILVVCLVLLWALGGGVFRGIRM